jgi:hypothetical protein
VRKDETRREAATEADFYVAPEGKDTNPGTRVSPFATLARARDALRKKVPAGITSDILILIRGGTCQQIETPTFGPGDSDTEKFSITFAASPGEKVVLSRRTEDYRMEERPEARTLAWGRR